MRPEERQSLLAVSLRVRERILGMSGGGGCFAGSALSCADLLVYLYARYLNLQRENLCDRRRNYFFLSKGHAVPALYGVLVETGILDSARLANHLKTSDEIYWHPNRSVPGVEFHAGSLGHLLAVAAGVALDCRLRGEPNRIVVLSGDGELNEGSMWEACLLASARGLDNLILVVDRNRLQANAGTEDLIPVEPLTAKFRAFGWSAVGVDGHDFDALERVFARLPAERGRPTAVVAHTVRGKGIPSLEGRVDRWFCNFSGDEITLLRAEMHEHYEAVRGPRPIPEPAEQTGKQGEAK